MQFWCELTPELRISDDTEKPSAATKYRRHSVSTKVCIGFVKHNTSLVACIVQNSMHNVFFA